MDIVDEATRSRMMSGIRGRDTAPELLVRHGLHQRGLRYVLGGRGLPGRPDLVFPSRRTVVFVHGCFWHRHSGCRYAYMPKTRPEFWAAKLGGNADRDARNASRLKELGWHVEVIWECALKADPNSSIRDLAIRISSRGQERSRPRRHAGKPT